MDTDRQLHELDARGWKRGLYADVERTFRAPIFLQGGNPGLQAGRESDNC